jgi:hypothetical protein
MADAVLLLDPWSLRPFPCCQSVAAHWSRILFAVYTSTRRTHQDHPHGAARGCATSFVFQLFYPVLETLDPELEILY